MHLSNLLFSAGVALLATFETRITVVAVPMADSSTIHGKNGQGQLCTLPETMIVASRSMAQFRQNFKKLPFSSVPSSSISLDELSSDCLSKLRPSDNIDSVFLSLQSRQQVEVLSQLKPKTIVLSTDKTLDESILDQFINFLSKEASFVEKLNYVKSENAFLLKKLLAAVESRPWPLQVYLGSEHRTRNEVQLKERMDDAPSDRHGISLPLHVSHASAKYLRFAEMSPRSATTKNFDFLRKQSWNNAEIFPMTVEELLSEDYKKVFAVQWQSLSFFFPSLVPISLDAFSTKVIPLLPKTIKTLELFFPKKSDLDFDFSKLNRFGLKKLVLGVKWPRGFLGMNIRLKGLVDYIKSANQLEELELFQYNPGEDSKYTTRDFYHNVKNHIIPAVKQNKNIKSLKIRAIVPWHKDPKKTDKKYFGFYLKKMGNVLDQLADREGMTFNGVPIKEFIADLKNAKTLLDPYSLPVTDISKDTHMFYMEYPMDAFSRKSYIIDVDYN